MQVYIPGQAFATTLSSYEARKHASWLDARYDAIKEIKHVENDLALITNHGRQMWNKHGGKIGRRVLSLSEFELETLMRETGGAFIHDMQMQLAYAKKNPAVSLIHGR